MTRLIKWLPTVLVSGSLFFSASALAQQYSQYYAHSRVSPYSSVFVIQGIEGEYGDHRLIAEGSDPTLAEDQTWNGYGIRNGVGIEMMRFLQMTLTHASINKKEKSRSQRNSAWIASICRG